MKKFFLAAITSALVFVGQTKADLYDFTFAELAGGLTTAAGRLDVVGGFATSGYLDVTGGFGAGHYDFVVASGVADGVTSFGTTLYRSPLSYFLTDGVVMATANPFLTEGGLLFSSGVKEFNFFYTDGSYYLVGSNGLSPSGRHTYNPVAEGTATLTAVPEGGLTLAMFGAALLGFAALRRRLAA